MKDQAVARLRQCKLLERLQDTPQLPTTSFTCVEMLCRTRHNTIDTFIIQRDANKLRGILQFSPIIT